MTRVPSRSRGLACALGTALGLLAAAPASAQESEAEPQVPETESPGAEKPENSSAFADAWEPKRQLVSWNEYRGPWFTIRVGGGLLYEGAAYSQDSASAGQIALSNDHKVRDFRVLLKGSFPKFERLSWVAGIMYDGPNDEWLFRETGLMVAVPELWGTFFIGRTKEGFSLNKVMSGYFGWTMERAPINDATIPILADGIKWLGYLPELGLLWNLGWYVDWLSKGQGFSSYSTQGVARLAWLPLREEKTGTLLHVGSSFRYGIPLDGQLQLRSRPEAYPAPYFLDTGKFAATNTLMVGPEIYFRPGGLLVGGEYFVQRANAPAAGNPIFHGGFAVVSWLVTGETRPYNTKGGFFGAVSPARPVFEGGPGAFEMVLNLSYTDLDSGTLQGGKFLRFTPMMNWHLSDHVRLEFAYGYGVLDRFGTRGVTQFFQSRIQTFF